MTSNSSINFTNHSKIYWSGYIKVQKEFKGVTRRNINNFKTVGKYYIKVLTEFTFDDKINRCLIDSLSDFKGVQKVYEITDSYFFLELMLQSLKNSPWSASVTLNTVEELNSVRKFITEDGSTGLTLNNYGEMGNGFSNPNYKRPFNLSQLLVLGVKEGAIMFDVFDTILESYYSMFGFKAVGRIPFNDEYKPLIKNGNSEKDWCFKQYERYNSGRPDVLFFIYDGKDRNTIEDRIGSFKSYCKNQVCLFGKDDYQLAKKATMIKALKAFSKE